MKNVNIAVKILVDNGEWHDDSKVSAQDSVEHSVDLDMLVNGSVRDSVRAYMEAELNMKVEKAVNAVVSGMLRKEDPGTGK